jgi:hypothetical protein
VLAEMGALEPWERAVRDHQAGALARPCGGSTRCPRSISAPTRED